MAVGNKDPWDVCNCIVLSVFDNTQYVQKMDIVPTAGTHSQRVPTVDTHSGMNNDHELWHIYFFHKFVPFAPLL